MDSVSEDQARDTKTGGVNPGCILFSPVVDSNSFSQYNCFYLKFEEILGIVSYHQRKQTKKHATNFSHNHM
jgi:hypothetical protein